MLSEAQQRFWMGLLLRRAEAIGRQGEVPVSALVLDGEGRCIGFVKCSAAIIAYSASDHEKAPRPQLRKAYLALALQYHPDKNTNASASGAFAAISRAWKAVSSA